MKIIINSKVVFFGKLLVVINCLLLAATIFVFPLYREMQNVFHWQFEDFIRILLILIDAILAYLIVKKLPQAIWGIGVTSILMFALSVYSNSLSSLDDIKALSFGLIFYSWDFILIIVLTRMNDKSTKLGAT